MTGKRRFDSLHWLMLAIIIGVIVLSAVQSLTMGNCGHDGDLVASDVSQNYWADSEPPERLWYFDGEVKLWYAREDAEPDEAKEADKPEREGDPEPEGLELSHEDNVVTELWFGSGEAIMTYHADEKRWTFSDRFLRSLADAIVPVLEERGFVKLEIDEKTPVWHYTDVDWRYDDGVVWHYNGGDLVVDGGDIDAKALGIALPPPSTPFGGNP